MQPPNRYMDEFDQLITDTLHDQMGPPPDQRIWEAVRREIHASSPPVHAATQTVAPIRLSWQQRLLRLAFQTPLAQGALAVVLFGFVILSQPELESLWHPVVTPIPMDAAEQKILGAVGPMAIQHRAAAFERLVEMDVQLRNVSATADPLTEFQPVADPALLRVEVRPAQPVRSLSRNNETPRYFVARATLSGGLRR